MANIKETRILIADDDADMRNLLTSILRQNGYLNVEYAADGQKALEALEAKFSTIGMAFLDINMPRMNGIEVMQAAKEARPNVFCVIITGQSSMDTVQSALQSGAKGFVVKPFTTQKIVDVLTRFERERGAPAR